MCGAARTRNDDLEAGRLRTLGESIEPLRRAMGGDDECLASDAQRAECFGGVAHGFPVRLASHDDGDWRRHVVNSSQQNPEPQGRIIGSALCSARLARDRQWTILSWCERASLLRCRTGQWG